MTEANSLNHAETKGDLAKPLEAARPRSIRRRGYYRALKRGETWAVLDNAIKNMTTWVCKEMYGPIFEDRLRPNPLLGLLPKD